MRASAGLAGRPVGVGLVERVVLELRAVDEEMLAVGAEVPTPVTSFVEVVVLDGVMDPAVTALVERVGAGIP